MFGLIKKIIIKTWLWTKIINKNNWIFNQEPLKYNLMFTTCIYIQQVKVSGQIE